MSGGFFMLSLILRRQMCQVDSCFLMQRKRSITWSWDVCEKSWKNSNLVQILISIVYLVVPVHDVVISFTVVYGRFFLWDESQEKQEKAEQQNLESDIQYSIRKSFFVDLVTKILYCYTPEHLKHFSSSCKLMETGVHHHPVLWSTLNISNLNKMNISVRLTHQT